MCPRSVHGICSFSNSSQENSKWVVVLLVATDTRRTRLTPSLASAAVSLTPRSVSTTWVARRPALTISLSVSTCSATRSSRLPLRLSRLVAFAPTSTSRRTRVRIRSTCVSVSTPSTFSVSTRCCRALVPIVFRPVCVEPTVSPWVLLPVSTSVRSSSRSVPRTTTRPSSSRLSAVPSSSSLVARRSSSPRSGVSPSSRVRVTSLPALLARSSPMVATSSTWPRRALSLLTLRRFSATRLKQPTTQPIPTESNKKLGKKDRNSFFLFHSLRTLPQ